MDDLECNKMDNPFRLYVKTMRKNIFIGRHGNDWPFCRQKMTGQKDIEYPCRPI